MKGDTGRNQERRGRKAKKKRDRESDEKEDERQGRRQKDQQKKMSKKIQERGKGKDLGEGNRKIKKGKPQKQIDRNTYNKEREQLIEGRIRRKGLKIGNQ